MLENTKSTQDTDTITLESLSDLTGFPVELIKSELFEGSLENNELKLGELRQAMMSYIDKTMLD